MRVLIIGSGGREHALAWKMAMEGHTVYVAPGNPGMIGLATIVSIDRKNFNSSIEYFGELVRFVQDTGIEFTIVGPEAPLGKGIVNYFNGAKQLIFGPTKEAARVELNKAETTLLLLKNHVPVPDTITCPNFAEMMATARGYGKPMAIKYSGPALGKGVELVDSEEQLQPAFDRLQQYPDDYFQIQPMLFGPELSYLVLCDGYWSVPIGSAQDYKPLYPGGPNTGGMGGFAPHNLLTPELQLIIDEQFVRPTITALRRNGRTFRGLLYFQLMLTKDGPRLIEINCRFGDPECQLLMPLLDCDLLPLLMATTQEQMLRWLPVRFHDLKSVGVVGAAPGYPESAKTGQLIQGIEEALEAGLVFQAGTTRKDDGKLYTSGGRVYAAVGTGTTYNEAHSAAYRTDAHIIFDGKQRRDDIASHLLEVA